MSLPLPTPPPNVPAGLPPPPPAVRGPTGPGPMGLPARPPTQVLLLDVPKVLHGNRAIREFLLPCGNARSIMFVPPAPGPNEEPKEVKGSITALVTLSHPDAALRVVSALKKFTSPSADGTDVAPVNALQAHLVPTNPDIPLPPAMMDPAAVQALAEKLQQSFEFVQKGFRGAAAAATTGDAPSATVVPSVSDGQPKPSSAYVDDDADEDEGADPLKAPEVLRLVQTFRHKLEQQQGSKATTRKAMVRQRVEQMLPVIRERIQEERQRRALAPGAPPEPPGDLPPPPPPPIVAGLPPPPPPTQPVAVGGPPAPPARAPRGVSNLPAWMTAQKGQEAAIGGDEPPAKRPRTTDVESFPSVPSESHAALRGFIAGQIKNFLGEEEDSLIDFILEQVKNQKSVKSLLPELKEVLEEDADACLQAILLKTLELANV